MTGDLDTFQIRPTGRNDKRASARGNRTRTLSLMLGFEVKSGTAPSAPVRPLANLLEVNRDISLTLPIRFRDHLARKAATTEGGVQWGLIDGFSEFC